ncbi:MAG: STAS/SEC14 domain-containing protein [Candidatus Eremiobacteraeota bacterium]|nr:STAS/SEC14 domain-containing protein [Candidatus Eremiobacteraeota bacterium]
MIEILERSKDNVLGFEVSGKISESDFRDTAAKLDEAIKKYKKISWLFVVKSNKYDSPHIIFEIMGWALKNLSHFDRMAVVGDKIWEELLIEADSYLFGDQYYDISQLEEAWQFVEGKVELMY